MTTSHFDFIFESTIQARRNMVQLMATHSLAQINTIPQGFSNNLVWNFGHAVITQQLLCYSLSGNTPIVDNALVSLYRKGSAPAGAIGQEEYQQLMDLSAATLEQFRKDYLGGMFKEYNAYTTSFGVTLASVEEAFQFSLAHEAMHLGTMMAMRKLV